VIVLNTELLPATAAPVVVPEPPAPPPPIVTEYEVLRLELAK
jgi:hypothetical protein